MTIGRDNSTDSRFRWPLSLREQCRQKAARLLELRFRIPPGPLISVSCGCCVLSGRSLRQADPSSGGVLLIVVCLCVCSRNFNNKPE